MFAPVSRKDSSGIVSADARRGNGTKEGGLGDPMNSRDCLKPSRIRGDPHGVLVIAPQSFFIDNRGGTASTEIHGGLKK